MLKKYLNEEWNWAILIFMNAKCLLEADGYLETTTYLFNDKGIDPLTGDKKTIPIYHQIENIDIQHPLAYKQIQNNCFEKLADGFLIIGQYTDDEEDVEKIFCRIEHNNKHFISYTTVIEEEDYCTFNLDELVKFEIFNNKTLPKKYAKILPCNQED